MRMDRRRRIYYRRRRQVQRQMVLLGWSLLLVVGVLSLVLGRKNTAESLAQKVVRSGSQKDAEQAKQITIEVEDEEERLERVRKEATEKGYPSGVIELLDKNE